jgi:transposase
MSTASTAEASSREDAAVLRVALSETTAALADKTTLVTSLTAECEQLRTERDRLLASYERLRLELELLKRRLFVAKAERADTSQLMLEFAATLAALDKLGPVPDAPAATTDQEAPSESGAPTDAPSGSDAPSENEAPSPPPGGDAKDPKKKPKGRRDVRNAPLEEERVELSDELFEELVASGKAERIGYEESCKLMWKRAGMRRLLIARVKYRAVDAQGEAHIETTPLPPESFPRSLAAPSLLAHVIVEKYCDGLPLNRIEDRFTRDGCSVDRGTLCRWVEDAGATVGATVIEAARKDALAHAFCIATDATGILVQPPRSDDGKRQPCRRGHYFVQIADRDHIFFEYTAKETSDAVRLMFQGYDGYVQADAKSVYDTLFREPESDDEDKAACTEVGCWSHARTKFWEATIAKDVVAREGLARIARIFEIDRGFKGKSPHDIQRLRRAHLKPHLDGFVLWTEQQYELVRNQRGLLRTALGYVVRQKAALLRVLDDGRLVLENNRSERELRRIAVGRKAWMFAGSDDHAASAGHLFSLVASARLHALDPEAYIRDLLRVLAHWPKDRFLELAPKYWAATRARLDAAQLAREVGDLTVPPPPAEQQTAPS